MLRLSAKKTKSQEPSEVGPHTQGCFKVWHVEACWHVQRNNVKIKRIVYVIYIYVFPFELKLLNIMWNKCAQCPAQ